MIQNLIFGILFLKYYFEHTTFLYSSTRSSGHDHNVFLISDFLAKSLNANKNQRKNHSFYNTFSLKKHSFYQPQPQPQ